MDYIFNYTSGRKIVIYTEGNSILYFMFPFRRNAIPGILKNDYLSDLTAVKFNGIIYYAYHNLDHRLVLCTIDGLSDLIIMSDSSNLCNYRSVKVAYDDNSLYVFYVMTNPLTFNSELHYYSPYSDNDHIIMLESSSSNIDYSLFSCEKNLILIHDGNFYSINPKKYENYYINDPDVIVELKEENTKLQVKIMDNVKFNDEHVANIQKLNDKIEAKDREIEKAKKDSDRIIKNSQKMIEDIKFQYNELADYTKKLQEEYKNITNFSPY